MHGTINKMDEQELKKKADMDAILDDVMASYVDGLKKYLLAQPEGSLTDADVIIMIMNLCCNISKNIYFSLKTFLPTSVINYKFLEAKLINEMCDSFKKISSWNPADAMKVLTVEQLTEIKEKGFVILTLENGQTMRVEEKDLFIAKNQAFNEINKEFH